MIMAGKTASMISIVYAHYSVRGVIINRHTSDMRLGHDNALLIFINGYGLMANAFRHSHGKKCSLAFSLALTMSLDEYKPCQILTCLYQVETSVRFLVLFRLTHVVVIAIALYNNLYFSFRTH